MVGKITDDVYKALGRLSDTLIVFNLEWHLLATLIVFMSNRNRFTGNLLGLIALIIVVGVTEK